MKNKKILITTSLILTSGLLLSGCSGNSDIDKVKEWQSKENLGEIKEVEIEEIDSFANADENDFIMQFIKINEENPYKEPYLGTFLELWNRWGVEDGDSFTIDLFNQKEVYKNFENYSEVKAKFKGAGDVYINGNQTDGIIKDLTIMLNNNLEEELAYKYCILSYYALMPTASEPVINSDMESLRNSKQKYAKVWKKTDKRELLISKTVLDDGSIQFELKFHYDIEPTKKGASQ